MDTSTPHDDYPAQHPRQDYPPRGASNLASNELRSPRKQMFSDLPTPAYHQTRFESLGAMHGSASASVDDGSNNTGMIPVHPTYASYHPIAQGEGGFGSLNDALRAPVPPPTVYNTVNTGAPTPRDVKAARRESAVMTLPPQPPGSF